MADERFPDEDELRDRQTTGLYPVGRALRKTYDADNHDSLGNDLTGLMLELARIDPDGVAPAKVRVPPAVAPVAVEPVVAAPQVAPEPRRSWWRRLLG